MFRLTIVLFLLFPVVAEAQHLLEIYKPHIPEVILNNQRSTIEVEKTIQSYGELDPDLIYFYITHLQLRHISQIDNPDSNLSNFIKAKTAKTKRLKKDWARFSYYDMIDKHDYTVRTRKIASFYYKFMRTKVPLDYAELNHSIDENLLNFYKYIFIIREVKTYDASINYKQLYEKSVSTLIDFFESIYINTNNLEPNRKRMLIKKAYEFSYLFRDSYIRDIPQHTRLQLYEFIYKLLEDEYKTKQMVSILTPVELISKNRTEKFEFTDPMAIDNRYFYNFDIQKSAYTNLGLLFKLKEEINSGSFIRVSIGYSYYQGSATTFSDTVLFSGERAVPGLYFNGEYVLSNPRNIKTYAFTAEFSFPVLYFSKSFFIEAGFHYKYQKIHFDFDFTKPGILEQPFSNDPQPFFDDQVIHINKRYNLLRPVASLNYTFFKPFTVRLDYIFPTNIRLGLMLDYPL